MAVGSDAEDRQSLSSGATGEADIEEVDPLPRSVVFELLTSPRRRAILYHLDEHGGVSTHGELAEHIAADENDTAPSQLTSQQRKRVYISLYQVHLPKLAAAEVIAYDKDRGTVELREPAEQLFPHLFLDPQCLSDRSERTDSWWTNRLQTFRRKLTDVLSSDD